MQSIRVLARAAGTRLATSQQRLATIHRPLAATQQLSIRFSSTKNNAAESAGSETPDQVLPANLQIGESDMGPHVFDSINIGKLDYDNPPANIRPEYWHLFVSSVWRLRRDVARRPKRSVLIWMLTNVQNGEELEMVERLHIEWRMQMSPLSQATTHAWAEACIRLNRPDIFMTMLLDRWKYRHLPIPYNLARFTKYLGSRAAQLLQQAKESEDPSALTAAETQSEQLLDDAFRVFALYPYYDVPREAPAYGALVEACCEINTVEAWRRALLVAEEALSLGKEKPMITREALAALETRSRERDESEMAERYKALAADSEYPAAFQKVAAFNKQGDVIIPPKLKT